MRAGSDGDGAGSDEASVVVVHEGGSAAEVGVGTDTVIGAIVIGCVFFVTGVVVKTGSFFSNVGAADVSDVFGWLMGVIGEIVVLADSKLPVDIALAAVFVCGTTGIIFGGSVTARSVCSNGPPLLDALAVLF